MMIDYSIGAIQQQPTAFSTAWTWIGQLAVDGPYRVVQQTIFLPGSSRSTMFVPGDKRESVFVPGTRRETVAR